MPSRRLLLLLFLCGATSWSADLRAADPPADPHGIDRLIRQLDSDDFEQREAASRALARIGGPALDELKRAAAPPSSAEVRWRAAALVEHIENSLDQLLADYHRFGLPLPPEDAPLVRFEERPSYMLEAGDGKGHTETITVPPTYGLGFLVEPAGWLRPAKLLYATETLDRETIQVGPPLAPQQLTADYLKANHSGPSESLVLALQMHVRGWTAAAVQFDEGFPQLIQHPARTELHLLAWAYWEGRLQDAADDSWSAAAPQMKALMAAEPDLDTPENHALLKSLQAALVPSHAKPGSVEALIDDLIHAYGTGLPDDPSARCAPTSDSPASSIWASRPSPLCWNISRMIASRATSNEMTTSRVSPALILHAIIVWVTWPATFLKPSRASKQRVGGKAAERIVPPRSAAPRSGGRRPASKGRKLTWSLMSCCPFQRISRMQPTGPMKAKSCS